MKSGVLTFLLLGTCTLGGWCLPLKSVFVTFPGDVLKNMTDVELADVSNRWFISPVLKSWYGVLLIALVSSKHNLDGLYSSKGTNFECTVISMNVLAFHCPHGFVVVSCPASRAT